MLSSPNCDSRRALAKLRRIKQSLSGTKNLVRGKSKGKGKLKQIKIS